MVVPVQQAGLVPDGYGLKVRLRTVSQNPIGTGVLMSTRAIWVSLVTG